MRFEVTILGSNSATPLYGRHHTAQVLNCNDVLSLIDCGEGTQLQLQRYNFKANRIKYVFISHLHGDHYLGLVGLISSMHLNGRKEDLYVFGPSGLKEIIDLQLHYSETQLRYNLVFHATKADGARQLLADSNFEVTSFPISHRIPCTGYVFKEKQRLPRINKEIIEGLDIPIGYYPLIKKGIDYTDPSGKIYKASELTIPAALPKSYAFCSDTIYTESYWPYIKDVDLLYHEATFLHEMVDRAAETFHTTALQAAEIANAVNVNKLLIGHFSARYKDLQPLLDESKTLFANTALAIEGQTFEI
ncbi:ribonuclease Z [Olivibacter domesticus]|uniref:Ribonuclease Z n=1 Tax=Olivibacter domesticus TaxID=407022 RepID=A0A1H7WXR9_OLID1|nr:ribonuclease Z [Olivibacter domesticus]SEM26402.1 ribonuclease Z [Olivibacter domesticus]